MSKKGHKGPHVAKKTDNPAMPETRRLDLKPGDHVILRVRQVKGLSDGPGALIEKEYIFVKKYPHHYSFEDLSGFRESFTAPELREIMVR